MIPKTEEKTFIITLVGPPNSGKTTLFNYLSGQHYKTVNYPGATVEYSVANFQNKFIKNAKILDSPGIISLVPNSPDEEVAVNALFNHPTLGAPDLLIVTVDANQIARHLYLVNQLIESGFNVVLAVTMLDILNSKGLDIDFDKFSLLLNTPVVPVDGRTGKGTKDLISKISHLLSDLPEQKILDYDIIQDKLSKESLVETYKKLEEIEQEVVIEIKDEISQADLDAANACLTVVHTSNQPKRSKISIDKTTLLLDRILLHRYWGIIFFFLIMALTFTSIFWLAQPLMDLISSFFGFLSLETGKLLGNTWYSDLISKGIIDGVGAVLTFVPQIIILFLILGLLEDTGYLARGAMLIDKPLSKIGLNGKSFVPMLSGFACAIPAMMAARTIPNKRERFLTIFIIPLMSCSARLPVYTLLLAFLFTGSESWIAGLVLTGIYLFSILSSVIVAAVVNKFKNKFVKDDKNSSFILELPSYKKPKFKTVLVNTYHSSAIYLKKAGPVILVFSMIIWFLTYFPDVNPNIDKTGLSSEQITQQITAERLANSYASEIGKFMQPIMTPLGMDWRIGVALISAFAAREVFVSSLALIFKVTATNEALQSSILDAMRKATFAGTDKLLFTPATVFGLIVFFIFALQCISTLAISRKETGSWKIPLIQLVLFTSLAYIFTFITVNGFRFLGIQ